MLSQKSEVKMKKLKSEKFLLSSGLLFIFLFLIVFKINSEDIPGRPVRIVSLSFPPGNNFSEILKIVDQEGSKGSDIIVLPETWRGDKLLETIDGESITELSRLAKKHNTYIISPIELKEGKHHYNSAILIDRKGKVIGKYDKVYPFLFHQLPIS